MPNRILRDCCDSQAVNSVDVHAERMFYRLIMKVDDYGRLTGSPRLLRPLLFPLLLDELREADLQRYLLRLAEAGLVRLYTVDGKPYLEIHNFNQRTRAKVSKYPPPSDGQTTDTCQTDDGHMRAYAESESETETVGGHVPAPPRKGRQTPQKNVDIPAAICTARFKKHWEKWLSHRREIKRPVTETSAKAQLADCLAIGEDAAIAIIEHTISSGWQGLRAPDGKTLHEHANAAGDAEPDDSPGFVRSPATPEIEALVLGKEAKP